MLLTALVANFFVLFYLVWTPASAIDCSRGTISVEAVFCLAPWLNWLGNLLLLAPTALIIQLLLPKTRVISLALCMLGLALTIEGVQFLVPGRDPNSFDVAVNSIGAFTTLLITNQCWRGSDRLSR